MFSLPAFVELESLSLTLRRIGQRIPCMPLQSKRFATPRRKILADYWTASWTTQARSWSKRRKSIWHAGTVWWQSIKAVWGVPGTLGNWLSTEREGFEPSTRVASCNSLAGSRLQPLGHLSSGLHTLPIPTSSALFYLSGFGVKSPVWVVDVWSCRAPPMELIHWDHSIVVV